MKTKKFSKKLSLNKKTISDLNSKEMDWLKGGGYPPTNLTCYWGCIPTRVETNCSSPCC